MGPKTVEACLNILNNNADIGNWNHTNIALIPKVKHPRFVSDYRIISLCNVSYKIISKSLANRLKKIIGYAVSEVQSAFVPHRAITDNIIIGHECLHSIRGTKTGLNGMSALKLDLSKAFDRVEWSYLRCVMKKLGFHDHWISQIMRCLSTVTFSILFNGSPRGTITPSRGIRQGDSLSPYMFLLWAEGLSVIIDNANRLGSLTSLNFTTQGPRISRLLFVDDSLIFLKSSESECLTLKRIPGSYGRVSGQCINFSKSAIIFSPNVHPERQAYLQSILNVNLVADFGNYLRLPSTFTRRKDLDWNYLKDRI